jgi:hypothetical protein
LPVLAASGALVLAGCGGDGATEEAASGGPLDEFFGEGFVQFGPGSMGMAGASSEEFEVSDEQLQQMRDTEEFVAECMADEGFEYTANVVNPEDWTDPWSEAFALPPDEFAQQYGYGISTLHYSQIEEDLPGDPNQEYRDSLSSEAQEAYERALYGNMMEWEGEEPPPAEERGCYGIASAEIYGEDPYEAYDEENDPWVEFESLMHDIGSLSQRVQTDPRVEEAMQAYFDCMADAGSPDLQYVGAAQEVIYERMSELEGWAEIEELYESGNVDEADELSQSFESQEPDPQELAELQEDEIELAVADYACMDEHYNDAFTEVSHALQEEFITEHRSELERYRDWAEENDFEGGFGFG